jgi:hypothetical protein
MIYYMGGVGVNGEWSDDLETSSWSGYSPHPREPQVIGGEIAGVRMDVLRGRGNPALGRRRASMRDDGTASRAVMLCASTVVERLGVGAPICYYYYRSSDRGQSSGERLVEP